MKDSIVSTYPKSYPQTSLKPLYIIKQLDTLDPTTHVVCALCLWSALTALNSITLEISVVLPTYNSSPEMDEPKICQVNPSKIS